MLSRPVCRRPQRGHQGLVILQLPAFPQRLSEGPYVLEQARARATPHALSIQQHRFDAWLWRLRPTPTPLSTRITPLSSRWHQGAKA